MTKTLARLADLEPAILAERPASADALGDLQRAIQLVNDGLVSGEPADTMAARYVACMEALVVLASQQGSSLAQCRRGLYEPSAELVESLAPFFRFYNSSPITWDSLSLKSSNWLPRLIASVLHGSQESCLYIGVVAECINDGARISLARTADDLLAMHWADRVS
jgi:hypothetical protein